MSNVKPMAVTPTPNSGLVQLLESLLDEAKRGDLISLSYFGEMLGGCTVTGTGGQVHRMADHLFAYELLKARVLRDA